MFVGMRNWFWGLLWVGATVCGGDYSPIACVLPRTCTLMGCSDSEQLTFDVGVDKVSDTQVSACRNERCWRGAIAAADLKTSMKQHRLQLLADDGSNDTIECLIDAPLPAGTVHFAIIWEVWSNPQVAAGDVLSATFRDSSGHAVFSTKGTISSFEEWFANGKACDEQACRAGSVEGHPE